MPNETVSTERFIEVWLEAMKLKESQSWIANKLGVPRQTVSIRAWSLRKQGIDVPKLSSGQTKTNAEIDMYNQMIKKSIDK